MRDRAIEPATKRAVAFIDGQNLYRHAKDAFGHHHPNYDPLALHEAVCAANGWQPFGVRFYTGVPSQERQPMWQGFWAKRILAMRRAGIYVYSRPIRYRTEDFSLPDGTMYEVDTAQEKGVDVRLAVDVMRLATHDQYDVALIFSQDQDLVEVVQEVREISRSGRRWIKVACAFPDGPKASFRRGIRDTDWFKMDEEFYGKCLDAYDYRPNSISLGRPVIPTIRLKEVAPY